VRTKYLGPPEPVPAEFGKAGQVDGERSTRKPPFGKGVPNYDRPQETDTGTDEWVQEGEVEELKEGNDQLGVNEQKRSFTWFIRFSDGTAPAQ
jgi:hypothetical protein